VHFVRHRDLVSRRTGIAYGSAFPAATPWYASRRSGRRYQEDDVDTLPTFDMGHVIVAGARVLTHRDGRAPTDEDIAELLGMPTEEVLLWVRGLERHGVVKLIKTPFDQRVDIVDHTRLETLPRSHDPNVLKEEIEAFQERTEAHQEELQKLLGENPDDKLKARTSKLSEELKRFKSGGRPRSPFDSDDDD
jgi:DNA-binding Lrp family transcriptional regulator